MPRTGVISHIALSASDYEESKKFYNFFLADILGYRKIMEVSYLTMWSLDSGESKNVSTLLLFFFLAVRFLDH
jgi:hypothetical protein